MLETVWNAIKDIFTKLYRFFVYGEYGIAKRGIKHVHLIPAPC